MTDQAKSRKKSHSNRRDEIAIVQEAISSLCRGLIDFLQASRKVSNVSLETETAGYSTNFSSAHSSSSAVPANDVDTVNGRIDFTFLASEYGDLCLGMIACKHNKLNIFNQSTKKLEITAEGKKALFQCFTQLFSKLNTFTDRGIHFPSYSTLLTTGKKWFLVEQHLHNGVRSNRYTTEIELMNDKWEIVPDAVDKVADMIQIFLISIEDVYSRLKRAAVGVKRSRQVTILNLVLFSFVNSHGHDRCKMKTVKMMNLMKINCTTIPDQAFPNPSLACRLSNKAQRGWSRKKVHQYAIRNRSVPRITWWIEILGCMLH